MLTPNVYSSFALCLSFPSRRCAQSKGTQGFPFLIHCIYLQLRRLPREKIEEAFKYINPRWEGYLSIALASLVTFSSVSGIKVKISFKDERFVAIFRVVTFVASDVILFLDRITFCTKRAIGSTIQGVIECDADDQVNTPGSNLFIFLWSSLFSLFLVCSSWIEAEAMVNISNVTQRVSQVQEEVEIDR